MQWFEEGGWWLPDGEEHLQQWMTKVNCRRDGRLTYQHHKYDKALPWVHNRGLALDVGAHVGLWSWPMSADFAQVMAFEPMAAHRACWHENLRERSNATLEACALGHESGTVRIRTRTPGSSGDSGVDPVAERSSLRASVDDEGEEAPLRRLDEYALDGVDFIKIDCEGYELYVLQGAVETLKRCRPCLIVEQKPETGMKERYGLAPRDVIRFLAGLGAKQRAAIQGDYVFSW